MIVHRVLMGVLGRVLADASIFISCAMSLAVFDIEKYTENGFTFEPDMEQSTGTIRCVEFVSVWMDAVLLIAST